MKLLLPALLITALIPLNTVLAEEELPTEAITALCEAAVTGESETESCISEDSTAWQLIAGHKTEHNEVAVRCEESMEGARYSEIENCITNDITAIAEIEALKVSHSGIVNHCQDRNAERGAAIVLDCAKIEIDVAESMLEIPVEPEMANKTETN